MTTAPLATSYPFLNILWTILIFMALVIWIWMVIMVLIDVFAAPTSQAGPRPPGSCSSSCCHSSACCAI